MAKKTSGAGPLRGAKLVKKAIEAGRAEALSEPEPVASALLKKMTLPNGEPLSPAMKELLKVDALWLGMEFDDEEGDIESVSLEELIEDHYGDEGATAFGEAIELFGGDCIALHSTEDAVRFLYVGEADETGEYPVLMARKEPQPWIGGFVPFDVWVGQELGALPKPAALGAVPSEYEDVVKALADANGDGRVGFEPKPGEAREKDEDEGDEDEDDEDEDLEGDEDDDLEDDEDEIEDDEDAEGEGDLEDDEDDGELEDEDDDLENDDDLEKD